MRLLSVCAVFSAAALAMVANGSAGASTDGLVNTRWQLVSVETGDGQTPTEVDAPRKYTVAFDSDGYAAFRVDCNRGVGSWQAAAPTAPSDVGSMSFGPIALTRMACPDPSLDQQVGAILAAVHSYRMADGHLSLIGDAGVLNWDAVPTL